MPHHHHHRRSGVAEPHLKLRNATPDPQPEALAAPDANADPGAATIVSVVYVTASKTFDGPVAGYSTLEPTTNPVVQSTFAQSSSSKVQKLSTSIVSSPQVATSATPQSASEQSTSSSIPSIVRIPTSSKILSVSTSTQSTSTDIVATIAPLFQTSSSVIAAASSITDVSSSAPSAAAISTFTTTDGSLATPSTSTSASSSTSTLSSAISKASSSSESTSTSTSSESSGGLSGGAKAGLALGILLGLVALLGLLLFCYRRKKQHKQINGKLDDEKTPFGGDGSAFGAGRAPSTRTARTASTAPRLSLRPVTQFLPNLGGNRRSNANQLAMTSTPSGLKSAGANRNLSPSPQPRHEGSQWERPADHSQSRANDPANPFGTHAELSDQTQGTVPASPMAPTNPFGNDAQRSDLPSSGPGSAPLAPGLVNASSSTTSAITDGGHGGEIATAAGASLAAGAAAGAASRHNDGPQHPEIIKNPNANHDRAAQPSPDGTDYSISSIPDTPVKPQLGAVAVTGQPISNVHRVQLDFKPSMDDELELRAGQLVRMLHEYDDGWALCIRLDRSQQGVAPRTCLSTRPVKPRQNGPPPGHPRGPPPPSMRAPPQGPSFAHASSQVRPLSPAGGRNSPDLFRQDPRPMSPAGNRNVPGPFGQPPHPMSPGAGPYAQPPRPLSPGGRARQPQPHFGGKPRSVSPGPYGGQQRPPPPMTKRRSNSASQVMARRASPPGPSPMNPNAAMYQRSPPVSRMVSQEPQQQNAVPARKPVPGQAL